MSEKPKSNLVLDAVRYIELHLDEDLNPSLVATQIGYSEFHFHRIFLAALGESVSEYIRRRRLHEAARRLVQGDESIMNLALRCKFESQEAFTRAFKKQFGETPGRFRKQILESFGPAKTGLKEATQKTCWRDMEMECKIVSREAEYAIGMGGSFIPKSVPAINALWNRFLSRSGEIKQSKAGLALGICCNAHPDLKKENDECIIYVAALPVEHFDEIDLPEGMLVCKLEAGRYAVFTHKGPLRNLPESINYIWGEFIPNSNFKFRDAPDFELYDERFDPDKLDGEIDIYVPIE
ncbi:MAG: AraC family transcriptional regulator [Candidatus Obscuribacterales bacterium]|nr:AraC family transcriptional regulator [Candidatus Obscuribacterales bacterium]